MATAEQLLAEDGSVRVPARLAASVHDAVLLHLAARARAGGGALTPDARALLAALNRAASAPVSPTKPADDDPATVMLGMGDAAALMGCTPQWARRLAARGAIPGAQRVGRIWLVPASSVDAFHHEREEDPDGPQVREAGEGRRRAGQRPAHGAAAAAP
ncbi:helix-turn-helix domain-containing protein [Streptomyces sp. NPDC017966]|uniref:helix-turn-helix domain-containing protein n=1 Tax=Streptomyces sp. NPDC017966 TaxID=3365023 RepID=UPI0037A70232